MYTPVPTAAPSDVSLCTGETFLIGGGVSDDVIVNVLVCPPVSAGEVTRPLVNGGLLGAGSTAGCVANAEFWPSSRSASFAHAEARIFYKKKLEENKNT